MRAAGALRRAAALDAGVAPGLAPLPGGPWALWRCAVLRGAGFPVRRLLRLGSPGLAAAADRCQELRREVEGARRRALDEVGRALDAVRARGAWDDPEGDRKPLLKALRLLGRGRSVREALPDASAQAANAELEGARSALRDSREDLERSYDVTVAGLSRELAAVARWEPFREAVAWQNPQVVRRAVDRLGNGGAAAQRNWQRRQREELVASYLQRYCAKNDTVGFFGPVGWAEISSAGPAVELHPGQALLERREVYFENWCVDALAHRLEQQPGMRPWLAPRLRSTYCLDGATLYPPLGPAVELSPRQARLLAACDGLRPGWRIAAELTAEGFGAVEGIYEDLEELCRRRVLVWGLTVPMELYPERTLELQLRGIGDRELAARSLDALADLDRARRSVAQAAGDPDRLLGSMLQLEETFTRLTGRRAHRNDGQTYAARGLVYEDCRRDLRLRVGPEVLWRLGPSLTLVLEGARWAAGELAHRVRRRAAELHAELCRQTGSPTVNSYVWVSHVLGSLFHQPRRAACFVEVERDLQARWARVLGLDGGRRDRARLSFTAAELEPRVRERFTPARPGLALTSYFSPDLMIAAAGEEALRRGDFELVLGEIHAGNSLAWSCFLSQHPSSEDLVRQLEDDLARLLGSRPAILPQTPKHLATQRMMVALAGPSCYQFHLGDQTLDPANGRLLAAGSVVVEEKDGSLEARTRDGSLRFDPLDLLGPQLAAECSDILSCLLPPAAHSPRVTVDGVVVARERWWVAADGLEAAAVEDPVERFLAIRSWARDLGLPRFCFFKVPTERKPCYLDLASPVYVDLFAKLARAAARSSEDGATLSISEMLPTFDQTWLPDAAGNRYTCELRFAACEGDGDGAGWEAGP